MAYQKQTWRDYDDTKTELVNMNNGAVVTPERMNHIETGIANSADKQEVTAQLAQKPNANEVVKKGYGTLSDFDEDTRSAIQGLEPGGINAVLGARNVKNENIDINSVGVEQAIFLKKGTNLFNKDRVTTGLVIGSAGEEATNPAFSTSDYIPVAPGQKISTKGVRQASFYGGSKKFIVRASDLNQEGDVITSPENAYYMRGSYAHNIYDTSIIQVNLGENLLPYEPYKVSLDSDIEVHLQGMNRAIVNSVNLFNKETVTTGGYYDSYTGEWIESVGHRSSDFIPVEYLKSYRRTSNTAIAGWDENKSFVPILPIKNPILINRPNIKYVTVAVAFQNLDTYMFTLDENYPDEYTPYFVTEYKLDKHWTSERLENVTETARDSQLELSEIHKAYDRDFTPPIELHLEDFSGYNQPYHPSVIYIPDGFAGYKYWMVQSPYPRGSVQPYRGRWEVPVVYKSTDGINWIIVANPLDDLSAENIANRDWMSDNHILYREDTNEIEVWYRLNILATGVVSWFRKKTSDGENWSERELLVTGKRWWSPSVVWDNVSKVYRCWYMTSAGLTYNTTPDGKEWGDGQTCSLDVFHDTWHTDVNYFNGEYHFLSYSRPTDNENTVDSKQIAHYVSDDGLNFTYKRILLDERDGNDLYSDGLYRACSLLDENNKVRMYFSADTAYGQTRIGLMIADNFKDMQGIRRFEGNNVILNDGRTLNELADEVARLKAMLE